MKGGKSLSNHKQLRRRIVATPQQGVIWISCIFGVVIVVAAVCAALLGPRLAAKPVDGTAISDSPASASPMAKEDLPQGAEEWLTPQELETLTVAEMEELIAQRLQDSLQTEAASAVASAGALDWLTAEAKTAFVAQLAAAPKDQWTKLIEAKAKEAPPASSSSSTAPSSSSSVPAASSSAAPAAAAVSAPKRDEALAAVEAANLGWMTAQEKAALADQLVLQDKVNWKGIIGGHEDAYRKSAAAKVDAADLSWLSEDDRSSLLDSMASQSKSDWSALISAKEAEKDDYQVSLAQAAVDKNEALDWLTGSDRRDFVSELAALSRSKWRTAMYEKAQERPQDESSSSKDESSSSGSSSKDESSSSKDEESSSEDEGSGGSGAWSEELYTTAGSGSAYDVVCQVVQNEMGGFRQQEALKAQALAAYTFIKFENKQGRTPSMSFRDPTAAVKKAVSAVEGQQITYNGKLAYTTFFSCSAGRTNNSADVWGGSYPYLVSVDSAIDENADYYKKKYTFTEDEMREKLEDAFSSVSLGDDPSSWIEIQSHNDGGYVNKVSIDGQKTTTGRVLRESVLGVASAAFEVEYDGDFTVYTYGYGHGVGMSQWGAALYAKDGWSYQDILKHYYTGVSVG